MNITQLYKTLYNFYMTENNPITEFGISKKVLKQIQLKLKEFPEITEAKIFGSRAIGNFKRVSDIDIAINGEEVEFDTVSHLHEELEENISTPLFFDVVSLNNLENINLIKHIQQYGKLILKK